MTVEAASDGFDKRDPYPFDHPDHSVIKAGRIL
jgi:hypothetical protein